MAGLLAAALLLGWWHRWLDERRPAPGATFCPWGVLDVVFAAAAFLAGTALASLLLSPWISGPGTGWAASAAMMVGGFSALAAILALVRYRYGLRPRDTGFALPLWPRDLLLAVGLFAAVAAARLPLSELFKWLHARGGLEIEKQFLVTEMLSDQPLWKFIVMIVAALVTAPIWEELAFRGFLQPLLRRYVGPAWSVVIVAALFSLIHDATSRFVMVPAMIFPLALALGYARERTGRLAPCILLHLLNNGFTVCLVIAMRHGQQ